MSRCSLALLAFFTLGCPDDPVPDADVAAETTDDAVSDAPETAPPEDAPAADNGPPPSKDQCTEKWQFTFNEGGAPVSPLVAKDGTATITAAGSIRRIATNGSDLKDCPNGFKAPAGELFGSPAQDADGTTFVGTTKGSLYAITGKCQKRWSKVVVPGVAIRAAPVLSLEPDGPALYVLDDRPVLTKCTDEGGEAICLEENFKLPAGDPPLPGAAPVLASGDNAFVAFPSRKRVTAVKLSMAKKWQFNEFAQKPGDTREVTSTLALTDEGKVLFAAGEPVSGTFENNMLYRLRRDSPDTSAVVDVGYPKPIANLPKDTVTAIVVGTNRSLYLATLGHGILKLDEDGAELWRFIGDDVSLHVSAVPTIGDDGALYFTGEPKHFYAVDGDGNRIFHDEIAIGGDIASKLASTSPVIRTDGTVLVHIGTELRAYACPSTGLALSSWPRYQRNNRATGNLGESE